jgi:hypothetical protein
MLWTPQESYQEEPFQTEAELESAIKTVSIPLFGPNRIYLDVKKLIGAKGGTKNVPDAYLDRGFVRSSKDGASLPSCWFVGPRFGLRPNFSAVSQHSG